MGPCPVAGHGDLHFFYQFILWNYSIFTCLIQPFFLLLHTSYQLLCSSSHVLLRCLFHFLKFQAIFLPTCCKTAENMGPYQ